MNVVMIIPTGIGCEIGGHAGDANPAAKLLASVCDNLIVHPNVVNASDINEMTENTLYVEGSIINEFLEGSIGLRKVYRNKILLAVNKPIKPETINAVNAARVTIGADIEIVELCSPLVMKGWIEDGKAVGELIYDDDIIDQLMAIDYDVLVVNSLIDVDKELSLPYIRSESGVNPWGGVEAMLSKEFTAKLHKPTIHAPIESEVFKGFNEVVDPRKAPEVLSMCYLHCCLKGAHRHPDTVRKGHNRSGILSVLNNDIDFMVSPRSCWGPPHDACVTMGIPIIFVKQNKPLSRVDVVEGEFYIVENYLEAVGVIQAYKAGVTIESVTRPIKETVIR